MIHAEVSIYPIGTPTTSMSFYIAKAVDTISRLDGIKYDLTSMGTILESDSMSIIFDAVQKMSQTIHNLGIGRVEIVIKIDSRQDQNKTMQEKLDSVRNHMNS